MYDELSPYFDDIVEQHADTDEQLGLLDDIFDSYSVTDVLDVACGTGRHSVALAEQGYDVTGVDYSAKQLVQAREKAEDVGVQPDFVEADANTFSRPDTYDAGICMWSTLGEEPMRYREVMQKVYESLTAEGIFVIENNSYLQIPDSREETSVKEFKTNEGTLTRRMRDRYTDNFRVREAEFEINGERFDELCITHLLQEEDWKEALWETGFTVRETYHDYDTVPKDHPERIVLVAQKPGA